MDALLVLTNIAIILLLGLLASLLSRKLKVSSMVVLVLLGVILGTLSYNGTQLFDFSPTFLVGIGILALVLIVFDGSSRFRFKEIDELSVLSLKLIGYFMLFSAFIMPIFTNILFFDVFTIKSVLYSLILAVLLVGTAPGAIFSIPKDTISERAKRVISLLQIESIFNTPFIVLIPFLLLELIKNIELGSGDYVSSFIKYIPAFAGQVIIGVGAGIVVGILVFKTMRKAYSSQFSPVAIITATILAYILAENLKGNGVLAVATLGFVFGNIYVKEKMQLQEFNYMLSNALEILVFVLIGLVIKIPFTGSFLLKSFGLFFVLVLCRMAAVFISLRNRSGYSFMEKLFISFSMPKGIAVAVVAFTFSLYASIEMTVLLDLMLIMMVYSLILSSIIDRFSKKFIKVDVHEAQKAADPAPVKLKKK